MVVNKRKKNSRARGTWTHGHGEKKKRRGAGSRGGRGMAGTGKRADTRKPSIETNKKYFGKHGFIGRRNIPTVSTINVGKLADTIETLVAQKHATKDAKGYHVNLTELGYDKLLGAGTVSVSIHITVAKAVEGAIEKINKASGSVTQSEAE